MKNLILTCIILLVFSSLSFAQSSFAPSNRTSAGPIAYYATATHNFGKIPQGVPVSTTFEIENKGKSPLIISDVKVSCGCTTPFYTTEPILPGKKGKIKAQFNAAAAGTFNKSITVTTNSAAGNKVKKLYIKGTVTPKN